MTREIPILFSGPMIRAILSGQKTVTRRIIKPQPVSEGIKSFGESWAWKRSDKEWFSGVTADQMCKFGAQSGMSRWAPGDRLWVRETWGFNPDHPSVPEFACFRADPGHDGDGIKWRPSIHMPRRASRITLLVEAVRVERLQDITEADAIAEGCKPFVGCNWWQGYREMGEGAPLLHQMIPGDRPPDWMIDPRPAGRAKWEDRDAISQFKDLWQTINGAGSWDSNPFVAAIEFRRVTTIEGHVEPVREIANA